MTAAGMISYKGKERPRWITIKAKYQGTCRRCGGGFAQGEAVRWAKRGGTWHIAAKCGASLDQEADAAAELDAAKAGLSTYLDALGRTLEVSQAAREMAYEDLTGASAGETF